MKNLKNIDLVSVNCVNPEESIKALLYSCKEIYFGNMFLISHRLPEKLPTNISFIQTTPHTHDTMNNFMLKEVPKYLKNEYTLFIHDDGFIINPNLWDDDFLFYDYIGAPWHPSTGLKNRVGNGGFVLKSKKFTDLQLNLPDTNDHDDGYVTNKYYDYFINNGCKYAPIEVAMKFSLESKIPECEYNLNNCFGFHGRGDANVFDGEGQQFKDKIKLLNTIKY